MNFGSSYAAFNNKDFNKYWHLLAFLILGLGIYFRLRGIGKWPLAVDEYYLAKSIRNVLEYGLPRFECGGYYERGLLVQYLTAPFFLFGSHDEFYLRIFPFLFNILAIPPMYFFGRKLADVYGGCLAVIVFSLSVWEVEFARFGRMYAPFQAIFLWYLVFLYKAAIEDDKKSKKWMYITSFLSIVVYAGSIFLAIFNFTPSVWKKMRPNWKDVSISSSIFLAIFLFNTTNFRRLGVNGYFPDGVPKPDKEGSLLLPMTMLVELVREQIWLILFIFVLLLSAFCIYKIVRSASFDFLQKAFFCVLILSSIFNLFGLVLLSFLLFILIDSAYISKVRTSVFGLFCAAIFVNFLFWIGFGFNTEGWFAFLNIDQFSIKKLLVIFFKYPKIFDQIIYPWIWTYPRLVVMGAGILSLGLLEYLFNYSKSRESYRFLLFIMTSACMLVGIIITPYSETRYVFFIYPIFFLLVLGSLHNIVAWLPGESIFKYSVVSIGFLGFFFVSEDFNAFHLWNIESKAVNFRVIYDKHKTAHYYMRKDYRTPAEFVNKASDVKDVIISTIEPVDYYLNRLDYFYLNWQSGKFSGRTACGGRKEIWSNADLIYREEDLWRIIDESPSTVWVISESGMPLNRSGVEMEIFERYEQNRVAASVDGMVDAYRISKPSVNM